MSMLSVKTGVYDVFLSFRGPDTRQGFTDCLYNILVNAGSRVFRDDDELRTGERIEVILQAVKDSRICIPIFSKNYASSAWCLRELAEMVKANKEIVPILFDVEPMDVKLHNPLYNDQLMAHIEKHGQEQVGLWKEAFKEVGRIKMSKLDKKGHYEFCEEFVKKDISSRLKDKQKHVIHRFVGRDNDVKIAMKLINDIIGDEGNGTEMLLGFQGVGGVGKTTLAKVIFNQLSTSFDCSSFVEGIRESSRINGIEHLQKLLLNDLSNKLKYPAHWIDPVLLMKANFSNRKVLIVLDDVSERQQIENLVGKTGCFGSGSVIIVTTRDKRVFKIDQKENVEHEMKKKRVFWIQEVWGLTNPNHALQLFSWHAFGGDSPPQEYLHLSKEAVSTTMGLPLALEEAGLSLSWKNDEVAWRRAIKGLKGTPGGTEVNRRFKTSFDALSEGGQQIFLDIACFFFIDTTSPSSNNNYNYQHSSYRDAFEALYLQATEELDTLMSMSWIKLIGDGNNVLWMHDQIRELGRVIIARDNNTSSKYPKNCRLWVHEEAVKTLKGKRDNDNIISLRLDQPCSGDLTGDEFVDLNNLRLLSLREPNFTRGFKGPLPKLMWLSLHHCPPTFNTTNLDHSIRLVVLDLTYSTIDGSWKGWRHIKTQGLKVLNLSYCIYLTSTPDLSKMEHLEKLVLEGCSSLNKIKVSKDNLKSLRHVNLKDCSCLCVLPKELFTWGKLDCLSLQNCDRINQLPTSLEKSKWSLFTLNLLGTSIAQIPDFVGGFGKLRDLSLGRAVAQEMIGSSNVQQQLPADSVVSLKTLKLCGPNVTELPTVIANLECVLLLGCSSMKKLPDTIGSLETSLVKLELSWSGITELPDSIGRLTRLESLVLAECKGIKKLPESVGDLKSLKVLIANSSSLTKLPASIARLKNLERLEIACSTLRKLPSEIGQLSGCLTTLDLSKACIRKLPSTMSQLSLLTTLELVDCDRLQELPAELPQSLTKLHVKSCRLKKVPADLDKLSNLTDLKLIDGSCSKRWTRLESSGLQSIVKLTKLTKLELRLSNLTPLSSDLKALSQLESVIIDCPSFKRVPELPSSVSELHLLSISTSSDDVKVHHLSSLANLKVLVIQGFSNLATLYLPESIEKLRLSNCRSLSKDFLYSPSGPNFNKLEKLEIVRCSEVAELCGLEKAESLENLSIESCESLEIVGGNLSELRKLAHLKVTDCPKLEIIHGFNDALSNKLRSKDFSGSDFLNAMSFSQVSVPLLSRFKGRLPGSDYLKATLSEREIFGENTQKILNMTEKVSLRLPGSKYLVGKFVAHKEELHNATRKVSTRLATKIFSKFHRNDTDVSRKMSCTYRRDGCYLTWLELSERHEDLASEKGWSEYDASDDDDDDITDEVNVKKSYPDRSSLLTSLGRDFLIRNDGRHVKIDSLIRTGSLSLYFAASWCVQCPLVTIVLALGYEPSIDAVVFVSLDEDEESFKRHFSMMPWFAIPFSDSDKRSSLVELFEVKKIPQLVVLDEDGKATFYNDFPQEIFPCPPERLKELKEKKEAAQRNQSLRSLLVHGSRDFVISLSEGMMVPMSQLEGKTICLLFLSPMDADHNIIDLILEPVYDKLKSDAENFEVLVLLSCRYDEDTIWEDVVGKSSWFLLTLDPDVYGQMISYFELSTLPELVVIGTDGTTLLSNAAKVIEEYGAAAYPFTSEKLQELRMQLVSFHPA